MLGSSKGASQEQRTQEEERERMLRGDYWQGPMSCNSEMARYDNTKISALNIIARLKERERPIYRSACGCRTIKEQPKPNPKDQPTSLEGKPAKAVKTESEPSVLIAGPPRKLGGNLLAARLKEITIWGTASYLTTCIWPLLAWFMVIAILGSWYFGDSIPQEEQNQQGGVAIIFTGFIYLIYWICHEIFNFSWSEFMQVSAQTCFWVGLGVVQLILIGNCEKPTGTLNGTGVILFYILVVYTVVAVLHMGGYFLGYGSTEVVCPLLRRVLPFYN